MKRRLPYIIVSILSLAIGFGIFNSSIAFIRNTLGDFFVVIFMYGLMKSFQPKIPPLILVITILIYSIFIEVLQLFHFPDLFGTEKLWVKILLGSSFSLGDILAYFLGIISIYWLDKYYLEKFHV